MSDLSTLLHADTLPERSPDLATIHRLGRRRRRRTRLVTTGSALAVVLVLAGAWALSGHVTDDARTVPAVTQDHRVSALTAYEKRVLAQVPRSFAVDGTVVVPATTDATSDLYERIPPATRFVAPPVRLGFDGRTGPGYLPTDQTSPLATQNAPRGSQVLVDPGPVWVACLRPASRAACSPAVLARADDGRLFHLYGFGTERFLRPGADMELFLDDDFSDRTWHQSLIGGLHGTSITRVEVSMVDGTTVEATVDSGRTSPGNTLFWARLPRSAALVRAYDADGKLVAEHRVRSCTDPVDCEVR